MKILILSDIHANWPALDSISEEADEVFFLGDAVNYGPQPCECVEWVQRRATFAVCGNHDRAISMEVDARCSPQYQRAAEVVGFVHSQALSAEHKAYLAGLPLGKSVLLAKTAFELVHSSPLHSLYGYHSEKELVKLLPELQSDVLLVGHTHLPCVRRVGKKLLVNPGSVGQPKDGDPRASYAVWEDGEARICRVAYPVRETVRDLEALGVPRDVQDQLSAALLNGGEVAVE